jgi:hypothetical protein
MKGIMRGTPSNTLHEIVNYTPRKNFLINGGFTVSQRGTTFTSATVPANSNDTYLFDRWILVSGHETDKDNDVVDVTQVTTPVPVGSYNAARFDIEDDDLKWGIVQVIEAKDSARLIGSKVSLSFKAAMAASDTSTLLRAAVISWSSTADTVTSDVVSDWNAEGTNPVLAANWTFENTPVALSALTATYQTYRIENISIDTASTANVAVFIWSDDMTNAVGDMVYITDVQLELGSVATPFEFRPYGQELALCQRYYFKNSYSSAAVIAIGYLQSTTIAICHPFYPVQMRASPPTPAVSAYTTWAFNNAGADNAATSINYIGPGSELNCLFAINITAMGAAGYCSSIRALTGQTAILEAGAEL